MIRTCKSCLQWMMLVLLASFLFILSEEATANMNNDVIKACVQNYNTWPDRSRCYHDWKAMRTIQEHEKQRQWLKNNPWFGGPNWNWKQCASNPECKTSYIRRY